ncbi:hypothetical protein MKX54_18650 [Alkalihalobacillus sp. FSL R5-0424]
MHDVGSRGWDITKNQFEKANDSIAESFAIHFFAKRAEGEPETPTEQNVVKTL